MNTSLYQQRAELRRQLRKARVGIPTPKRRVAEKALQRSLLRCSNLRRAKHIAAYAAVGSEINPQHALMTLASQGHQIYYPRIRRSHMDFLTMRGAKSLNRHGIAEPKHGRPRPLWAMGAILIPLLGFDQSGQRLGQGGGYYDRALSKLRFKRPRIIGLAFDEQRCDQLPTASWDQPLDGVITPTHTYQFRT